ncbi:hypothetical protein [Aquibacillus kalidii]|uniref:hypothetical protein n=1 Tax=Aquibacillus kalidii TaxID=2762597 RepID=UPI001647625F|nr:hypothetical protein [Aquibacillus kalidii]
MGDYFFYSDFIYDNGEWTSKCLQIQEGKFTRFLSSKSTVRELNVEQFWVGPGKVYVDLEEPVFNQVDMETTVSKYIYRGCTLLLCQFPLKSRRNFKNRFLQFKNKLARLPLDYMIVPRIPISLLHPDQIRFFGRRKVPFIILELDNIDDLLNVKWEWIEQAQSFTGIPIIYDSSKINTKMLKELKSLWKWIGNKFQMQLLDDGVTTLPLPKETLRKTGISPFKGEFIENSAADYNLFPIEKVPSIDDEPDFRYHKAIPVVTVMNGTVLRSNHLIEGEIGDGSYQKISIPNHFL